MSIDQSSGRFISPPEQMTVCVTTHRLEAVATATRRTWQQELKKLH